MYDDCFPRLKTFLVYLETVKGRAQGTVYGYYTDLKMFFRFFLVRQGLCSDEKPFEEISIREIDETVLQSVRTTDLLEFINFASTEKGNNRRSCARKIASLRNFFHYLYLQNDIPKDIAGEIFTPGRLPKTLPKHLELEDCQKLLEAVGGAHEKRDYCILVLFLNCGMRLSELCGVNEADIRDRQLLLRGKGSKERVVYLNDACTEAISNYRKSKLQEFANKDYDRRPLFLSRTGKRLGKRRVEDIVDQYLEAAGLKNLGMSTHKLRHTAATLMYQNHTDVRTLQEILGHANLGTTQIYTHLSNEQIKNAMSNNPVAKLKKQQK